MKTPFLSYFGFGLMNIAFGLTFKDLHWTIVITFCIQFSHEYTTSLPLISKQFLLIKKYFAIIVSYEATRRSKVKTLTLLFNQYGAENITFKQAQLDLFNITKKNKLEKLIKENNELSAALDDSGKSFSLYGLAHLIDRKRNLNKYKTEGNTMLNTKIGLYEFYGTAIIDFDDIREAHLGCSHDVATRKIKSGELPLVTFRLTDSQKGKLLVHVDDLTELVELQRMRARKEIQKHIDEFKKT